MRKMYIQPKNEITEVTPHWALMGEVSKGENPNEDEMAHAPERGAKVY